ncbi:MAG: hypothetical protein GY854_20290 [Deltaproteobacteria bacterium]|nr:hypothetical protein [Deltaproteobacteria bacterium]
MNIGRKTVFVLVPALCFVVSCLHIEDEDVARTDLWTGPIAPSGETELMAAASVLEGLPGGYAGDSVAGVGDVDGDGLDDLLIGDFIYRIPGEKPSPTSFFANTDRGAAFLIYGRKEGLPTESSLGDADAIFHGESIMDTAGEFVAKAGDVNGDGYADFLVTARRETNMEENHPTDPNGDMMQIWRPNVPAKVYLYYGSKARFSGTSSVAEAPTRILVEERYRRLWTGEGIGDLNRDGFDDIAVVVHGLMDYPDDGLSQDGKVYVFFGKADGLGRDIDSTEADLIINPGLAPYSGQWMRSSTYVAAAGDVNGDGFDDLLVAEDHSRFERDESSGIIEESYNVYLILGQAGLEGERSLDEIAAVHFRNGNSRGLGYSIASAGDVNNDGFDDLLIGDPMWNTPPDIHNLIQQDSVHVVLGGSRFAVDQSQTEPTLFDLAEADTVFVGSEAGDKCGHSLAGIGDIDGDGVDDILVGLPGCGPYRGAAHVLYGNVTFGGEQLSLDMAGAILTGKSFLLEANTECFDMAGRSIDGAGDFNGDGYADLIIGAPGFGNDEERGGRAYVVPGGPHVRK